MQYCIIQIYSLQLIMFTYISMQKAANLMVKHIARPHFLGSCRVLGVTQTSCYITEAAPCFGNTNLKTKFNRNKSSNF